MKISVVIPVYNEENYIKSCLEGLGRQNMTPYEIIIVDNNCTDRTIEIAEKNSLVRVVKENKQGIIYARNTGFSAASGDVIARCDADTVVGPDWIDKIKKHFNQSKIVGLSGMVIYHDDWFFKKSSFLVRFFAAVMRFWLKHNILTGPNMAITKSAWNKVKKEICLDDRRVHEDIDLSIHLAKYGKIKFDPGLKVYSSARRMKHNPASFFFEYPLRLLSTLGSHKEKA